MRNLKRLVIVGLLLLLSSTPATAADLYEGIWDSNDVVFPDLGSWQTDTTGIGPENEGCIITGSGETPSGLWSLEGSSILGGSTVYIGPYAPGLLLFYSTFVWDYVLTFDFYGDTYYAPLLLTTSGQFLATITGDYAGWVGPRLLESEGLIYEDYIGGVFLNPTGFIGRISHTAMETGYDDDGNWGVYSHMYIEIDAVPIPLAVVDIKPGSCPNPINTKSKGVLPVAILGTEDFDVSQIDPASIALEGIAPLRWDMEDVSTPYEPLIGKETCDECSEEGPDGYMDLTLKFRTQEIVAAIGDVEDRGCFVLTLTGNLKEEFDGTPIVGEDVVVILKKK